MKKIAIIAGGAFGKAVFEELEKRNFEPVLFAGGGEKLSDFISESGALAAVVSPNFKLPSENKSAPQIIKGCGIAAVVAAYKQDMETSAVYDCICAGAFGAVEIDQFSGSGFDELADKLSLACVFRSPMRKAEKPVYGRLVPIAAIGASTGGPGAIAEILSALSADFPGACVIVQHMDSEFSGSLAGWLSRRSKLPVEIAAGGDFPKPGRVYVSRADANLGIARSGKFMYETYGGSGVFCPSVDFFFKSLASARAKGCAALLTGMGDDGAEGLLALKRAGWRTIAQDEATSAVYGMPKNAVRMGAASEILPLDKIGARINFIIRSIVSKYPDNPL